MDRDQIHIPITGYIFLRGNVVVTSMVPNVEKHALIVFRFSAWASRMV